jgi:hypothetical protein
VKCNLIVPGFAKSGTSSLHAYLDQHPLVCMSQVKEPHFFSSEKIFSRGTEWHDSLFAVGAEVVPSWFGESSTSYAVWEPALARIKTHVERPRFIVLMRHPIERLLSHYRWMYALGLEKKNLDGALTDELGGDYDFESGGRVGNYPWYLRHSRYAIFGDRLIEMFGSSNVLFIRSEELARRPELVLGKCWEFLGLDTISLKQQVELNQTQEQRVPRALGLRRLINSIPRSVRNTLDPQRRLRKMIAKTMGPPRLVAPDATEEDLLWLDNELTPDIKFFNEIPCVIKNGLSQEQGLEKG